ncbi:tonsoku-like protein [Tubulanus polymorphus]|uniref:tonsoku-like protein n=1 Tax=Tubulanus polymorphus TaxID=672921 RepID=UPI003DA435E2
MNKDSVKEITRLQKEKKKVELKGNLVEQAEYCNCIGEIYSKNGDFTSAIDEHKEALNLFEALGDEIGRAVAHRRVGECLMEQGYFDDALKNQKRYLDLARSCQNKTEEQRAWVTLGRTYLCRYENVKGPTAGVVCLQQAEEAFEKSLEISDDLKHTISVRDYDDMRARSILNLGIIQENKKNTDESVRLYRQASALVHKHDLYEIAMRCEFNLASMFLRLNKYPDSIQAIIKCIDCCTKGKDLLNKKDAMIFKAKIHVELEDFAAAKTCLKECHKICKSEEDRKYIKTLRIAVHKLKNFYDKLNRSNDDKCLVDFEKMADFAAKIGAYFIAITYYRNTLQYGKTLGKTDEDMKDIYNSLAMTYCDTQQYEQSLKYYNKELKCQQGNYEQMSRTWLNIADVQERAEYEYKNVLHSINRAYEFSKKAKHKKLQVRCLKHVAILNDNFGKCEEHEKAIEQYQKLKEKLCLSDSEDESIEEIDDDDDDGDEEFTDSDHREDSFGATSRQVKRYPVKLNDKGETELHVACIKGNLKKVTQLLERGHPINTRDFCGWTPLHEVCNHGFFEIAEHLISKGASINDRGGPKCEGLTPLHDACTNGHIELIELLVDRGANLHAKDHKGNTPFDCLRQLHLTADLTHDEKAQLARLERKLHFKMTGDKNPPIPIVPQWTNDIDNLSDARCDESDGESALQYNENSEDYRLDDYRIPLDNTDLSSATGARHAYRDVMKSMRKGGASVHSSYNAAPAAAAVRHSALISEENENDDWLVRDVAEPVARRNRNVDSLIYTSGTRKRKRRSSSDSDSPKSTPRLHRRDTDDDVTSNSTDLGRDRLRVETSPDLESLPDIVHSRRQKETTSVDRNSAIFDDFDDNDDSVDDEAFYMINFEEHIDDRREPAELAAAARESSSTGASTGNRTVVSATQLPTAPVVVAAATVESTLRITVRILGTILLLPIAGSERGQNIEWLCSEVASRYFQLHGIRPLVSLKTHDGAFLCPNDLITHVLSTNEQLEAVFIRWDLAPLPDRYKDACNVLKSVAYRNIRSLLQTAIHSSVLDLSSLFLRVNQLQPVFSALQCESSLTELILHGNRIDDTGVVHLKKALSSMSNLLKLDLSSNHLTSDGLKELTSVVTESTDNRKSLQNVTTLNLSYNFLGDHCLVNLVPFLRNLPQLTHLNLMACKLTAQCFTVQPLIVKEALQRSSLTSLNMSMNTFANIGIELLLKSLNPQKVTDLVLTNTVPSASSSVMIPTYVFNYLKQPGCALKKLNIENCFIPDDALCNIIQKVEGCSIQDMSDGEFRDYS